MPFLESSFAVLALWALVGYLMGSIPFGMVLARIMNLGNLRDIGSGNIGATNVLRTGNKKAAALTLVFDGAKGGGRIAAGAPFRRRGRSTGCGTGRDVRSLLSGVVAFCRGQRGRHVPWPAFGTGMACRGGELRGMVGRRFQHADFLDGCAGLCCRVDVFHDVPWGPPRP